MTVREVRKFFVAVCLSFAILVSVVSLVSDLFPPPFDGYAAKRWWSILFLFIFSFFGLSELGKGGLPRKHGVIGGFCVLLALLVLFSYFLSDSTPHTIAESYFFAFFFLALTGGIGVALRGLQLEVAKAFIWSMTSCALLYGLLSVNVYLFAISDDFRELDKILPWGFVNIRYWADVAAWLLPLFPAAVICSPFPRSSLWRFAVLLAAGLWWWMVLLTTARGATLGIMTGMVAVCLIFGRKALPWFRLSAMYCVFGVGLWLLLSLLVPSLVFDDLTVRSIKLGSSGRLIMWQEALLMSLQNFPFGTGPQSWITHAEILDEYAAAKKFGHPHNMYLLWAAEYGWIFIFTLFALGLYTLKLIMEKNNELDALDGNHTVLLISICASISSGITNANFALVFLGPSSAIIGLVLLSLLYALTLPEVNSNKPRSIGKYQRGLRSGVLFLVLAIVGHWVYATRHYQIAMELDRSYYDENIREGILPRYWLHGYFPRHPEAMP